MQAYTHDLNLYPCSKFNQRGDLIFERHPAMKKLRKDVKDNLNIIMTPAELQMTRDEYKCFDPRQFLQRVFQEERRQKFNYYIEEERKKTCLKRIWGHSGRHELLKDAREMV